jgi:hypothetical protein
MLTILDIIFNNPNEDARREACGIFSFTNQNNFDVQKLTAKMGALNLMHQYVRESNIKNREAVIGALASYLKGINTDGKREFISEFSGIEFLKGAIKDGKNELRLSKKLLLLLQDLVQNDSLILHGASPSYIR